MPLLQGKPYHAPIFNALLIACLLQQVRMAMFNPKLKNKATATVKQNDIGISGGGLKYVIM